MMASHENSPRASIDGGEPMSEPEILDEPQSLSKAVWARRDEFTRPRRIKIKIGSWNVAACPGTEHDLAGWFIQGRGVDERLAGLDAHGTGRSQEGIESAEEQEERVEHEDLKSQARGEGTLPRGDHQSVPGYNDVGLYVLGLQEVVQLTSAREYIGKIYTDTEAMDKWRTAFSEALPPGYSLITEQQLSGLMLLVFASAEVAPSISCVSTISVGTGIMGYLGNKGAITTRILLGETTRMVFVNSHLASGSEPANLERRCWDVSQILQRTRFEPITVTGQNMGEEAIGEEDFAFWFGDLNFRLDGIPGPDIRRLLMLHTRGEYAIGDESRKKIDDELGQDPIIVEEPDSDSDIEDGKSQHSQAKSRSSSDLPDPDEFIEDPAQDPESLQATINCLLPHDQLRNMQRRKKVFHDGWREGQISFLPTYKYDIGSVGVFDSSEKKRAPSWCDRILYRTRKDKYEFDLKIHEALMAKKKDEEMKAQGLDAAAQDEDVLFDYDPNDYDADETDNQIPQDTDENLETVKTKEGYIDKISLDVYTSHQRVLSSDHKPIVSVFTLEYDAIIPDLKSLVLSDVVRELDRAENEGRPGITIVVEQSPDGPPQIDGAGDISTSQPQGVDFGTVSFKKRVSRNITIANTSQVEATMVFVERPGIEERNSSVIPDWMTVEFITIEDGKEKLLPAWKQITLPPGETMSANLSVFVSSLGLVKDLNKGTVQLDDILVLRVTDGRDHFIPIHGVWLQSCFARSMAELIRVPEGGIRALTNDSNETADINSWDKSTSAPRELFKLTEAIEALAERVVADTHMIESAKLPTATGWPFDSKSWELTDMKERERLRSGVLEALDCGGDVRVAFPADAQAKSRFEILSEVLIAFLGSITDRIITTELWAQLDTDMTARGSKPLTNQEDIKAWVLDALAIAPNHNISFVFLTSILAKVVAEIAPVPKSDGSAPTSPTSPPAAPVWPPAPAPPIVRGVRGSISLVRRMSTWKPPLPGVGSAASGGAAANPQQSRRRDVEKAYARVFEKVIFKDPAAAPDGKGDGKAKGMSASERRRTEERRKDILEAFLKAA